MICILKNREQRGVVVSVREVCFFVFVLVAIFGFWMLCRNMNKKYDKKKLELLKKKIDKRQAMQSLSSNMEKHPE